jgi:fatty-acyl-CoA synthase
MAIVVRREGATVEASEIKAHVMREAERGVISKYAVPEYVRFVDSIDKTSVGKPNKKVLREKYAFTRVGFS